MIVFPFKAPNPTSLLFRVEWFDSARRQKGTQANGIPVSITPTYVATFGHFFVRALFLSVALLLWRRLRCDARIYRLCDVAAIEAITMTVASATLWSSREKH